MTGFKKVAFYTLGCKLNFSETSTLSRLFEEAGIAKVEFEDTPDIYVINTCSVTENADKKCKQIVRRAKKTNPSSFVVVVGCFAQLKPDLIAKFPGVNLVLGANEKFNILEYIEKSTSHEEAMVFQQNIKHVHDFVPSHSFGDRTRSFLKIQDGCDYFCTFCTIPLARGKSRNASIQETLQEAKSIAKKDIKEIVLTGVNIGDFGQGGPENFYQLIRTLDAIDGIERFRISSIEPNLLSNEIIDFCLNRSRLFAPHFHIPLQSGSDRILGKMRRKYDTALFRERINQIKNTNANTCIGIDVIVGFPGETDDDFYETYRFLDSIDFSYLHVFTYSERANTGAPKLGEKVPMEVRRERSKKLHILSEQKKKAFYTSQQSKVGMVLFEEENNEGWIHGFTENYIKVRVPYRDDLRNTLHKVELKEVHASCIMDAEFTNVLEKIG